MSINVLKLETNFEWTVFVISSLVEIKLKMIWKWNEYSTELINAWIIGITYSSIGSLSFDLTPAAKSTTFKITFTIDFWLKVENCDIKELCV